MEAVRKSQPIIQAPPATEPAAPKLTIEKFADAGITCLKFSGTIDESFDGKKSARSAEGHTLVLDLGGVKKISSFGIREWVDFVGAATKQAQQVVIIEAAPKVVDQLNMVANFTGGGRVFSFYAPFRCDYCDSEHRVLLDVAKDFEAIKAMKLAERPCPACRESMYFDEDGSTYFSYLLGQGAFELDPAIVQFLATKLDYRIGTIDAKVRVDKLIEGRITYLRLAGDLNNTFPREKLAEGIEGLVVVDVAGVTRVEPAGAAEWRSFVQQVSPLVEQLLIVGVPLSFLEKLCGKDDLGAKGQVVDFTLPYTCGACGTTSAQSIDVQEHHGTLKFATAPELHCHACKAAMQCSASEAAMTILPTLPKPSITKDITRVIGELRARKIDHKKPSTGIVAIPKGEAAGARTSVRLLLAAIVAVLLAGAVILYVQSTRKTDPGQVGLGSVAARSQTARPSWVVGELAPGAASCTAAKARVTCLGVSSVLASQEEAEQEASDAALEALAYEASRNVKDASWNAAIPPLFQSARDAALAAFGRDPQSTLARRALHDGRRAVARALENTSATQVGARYWEAFDTAEGRRYVAFAEIDLPAPNVQGAGASYAQAASALGATAVAYYPELGWRFPKLEHGAIVTKLERGALQDLGLAEHYIVLAVDGRDIVDEKSFAKIVGEEYAQLTERGGTLRLLVQTDSGEPREFSKTIPGPPVDSHPTTRPRDTHTTHELPTGGVNVWDRFGGNRGSGRDDPTQ